MEQQQHNNETVLSSYYHHPHHNPQPPHHSPSSATSPPPNGLTPPPPPPPPSNNDNNNNYSAVSPTESKKKRGRPRKYATPEEAAAARRAQLAQQPKKDRSLAAAAAVVAAAAAAGGGGGSVSASIGSKRLSGLASFGNVGQGFTPHIVTVAAGEDVYQKIMLFMQQSKREICILSASGSVSSPFLRQPATSGGNVTYEGRFDILSLSGSYVRTELGGRTGGLSVCLSNTDGQIIGGGIGGPLRAAGPVEVIVGTFLIDAKKDIGAGAKGMDQNHQML